MSAARAVREAYDTRFAPLDLNLTQASILAYVQQFGPVSQTKIADHLHLGRAVIGATIDRLQLRGLVERLPDADDRRVWRVRLSPAGLELAQQVAAIDQVLRAELRTGITRAERQTLADVLTRLQGNLINISPKTPTRTTETP
jgi:DNA-binding MarR family transcriptional regulator